MLRMRRRTRRARRHRCNFLLGSLLLYLLAPFLLAFRVRPAGAGETAPTAVVDIDRLSWQFQSFPAPSLTSNVVSLNQECDPDSSSPSTPSSVCYYYLIFDNQDTWLSLDGAQWTRHVTNPQESIIAPNGMGQALASLGSEALLFGGLDTQLHPTIGTFIFSRATPSP